MNNKILLLLLGGFVSSLVAAETSEWTFSIDENNITVETDGEGFATIVAPDLLSPSEPAGAPDLPFAIVRFVVPDGYSAETVALAEGSFTTLSKGTMPAAIREPATTDSIPQLVAPDLALYAAATNLFEVLPVETASGVRFLPIKVWPIRYNSATKEISVADSLALRVDWTPSASASSPSTCISPALRKLALSGKNIVPSPKTEAPKSRLLKAQTSSQASADVVIISPPAFVSLWEQYKTYREGTTPYSFAIKNTDEIYRDFDGTNRTTVLPNGTWAPDHALAIHKYIESVYATGTHTIILGGTPPIVNTALNTENQLPIRYVRNGNDAATVSTFYVASDLYFACMDKNDGAEVWDAQGDGVYCGTGTHGSSSVSLDKTGMDWAADLVVMRIPITEKLQCYSNASGKYVTYSAQQMMDGFIDKIRRTEGEGESFDGRSRTMIVGGLTKVYYNRAKGSTDVNVIGEREFFDDQLNMFDPGHPDTFTDMEVEPRLMAHDVFSQTRAPRRMWTLTDRIRNDEFVNFTLADYRKKNYPQPVIDSIIASDNLYILYGNSFDTYADVISNNGDVYFVNAHGIEGGVDKVSYHTENLWGQTSVYKLFLVCESCLTGRIDNDTKSDSGNVTYVRCAAQAGVMAPLGGGVASFNNSRNGLSWGNRNSLSPRLSYKMCQFTHGQIDGVEYPAGLALLKTRQACADMNDAVSASICLEELNGYGDPFIKLTPQRDRVWTGAAAGGAWSSAATNWTSCVSSPVIASNSTEWTDAAFDTSRRVYAATDEASAAYSIDGDFSTTELRLAGPADGAIALSGGRFRSTIIASVTNATTLTWESAGGAGRDGLEFVGGRGTLNLPGTAKRYFGTKFSNVAAINATGGNATLDFSYHAVAPAALSFCATDAASRNVYTNTIRSNLDNSAIRLAADATVPVKNSTLRIENSGFLRGANGAAAAIAATNASIVVANGPRWDKYIVSRGVELNGSDLVLAYPNVQFGESGRTWRIAATGGENRLSSTVNEQFAVAGDIAFDVAQDATLAVEPSISASSQTFTKSGAGVLSADASAFTDSTLNIEGGTVRLALAADASEGFTLCKTTQTEEEFKAGLVVVDADGEEVAGYTTVSPAGYVCFSTTAPVESQAMPKPVADLNGLSFNYFFNGSASGDWGTLANWSVNEEYQSIAGPTAATGTIPGTLNSSKFVPLAFDGELMGLEVDATDGYKHISSANSSVNNVGVDGWALSLLVTNGVQLTINKVKYLRNGPDNTKRSTIIVDETSQLVFANVTGANDVGTHALYVNSPSGILFRANYNPSQAGAYEYYLGERGSVQYAGLGTAVAMSHTVKSVVLDLGDAALTGRAVAIRKLVGFTSRGSHTFSANGAAVTAFDTAGSVATVLASGAVSESDVVGSYFFRLENDGYYVDYVVRAEAPPPVDPVEGEMPANLSIAATEAGGTAVLGTDYTYDSTSNVIWVFTGTPMTISTGGSTLAARIKVKSGVAANVTLNNCVLAPQKRVDEDNALVYSLCTNHTYKSPLYGTGSVDLEELHPMVYDTAAGRVIDIEGASLTLNVEGTNTLTAADCSTAVFCPRGASLTIQGAGTLNVNTGRYLGTAGIGGEALLYDNLAGGAVTWSAACIIRSGYDTSGNTAFSTNDATHYVFLDDNDKFYEWRGDELWLVKDIEYYNMTGQLIDLSYFDQEHVSTPDAIAQGIIAEVSSGDGVSMDITGYRIWNDPSNAKFANCASGSITIREATVNVKCPCEIMSLPKYYNGSQMNVENLSVGIGGFGGGPIRIESGAVKVETGYKSQGIGSLTGDGFEGIYITGGTVIADCGYNVTGAGAFVDLQEDTTFGSGIGWGAYNVLGDRNVVIEIGGGANVTASARFGGAGVGGGRNGMGSRIRIYGNAVVNATGGYFAAGLGGGCEHAVNDGPGGNCGTGRIIIEDNASVTARGGNSAPGVGSGYAQYAPRDAAQRGDAASGEIIIRGNAQVTATGGDGAPSIGSGRSDGGKFPFKKYTASVQGIKIYGNATVVANGSGTPKIGPSTLSGGAILSSAERFLQYVNLSSRYASNTAATEASNTLLFAEGGLGYVCSGVVTVPDDLAGTLALNLGGITAGRDESKILRADGSQLWPVVVDPGVISVNFTHGGASLSTADEIGYAPVAGTLWDNVAGEDGTSGTLSRTDGSGNKTAIPGCSLTVSGSRGSYSASNLSSASNMLHGYVDERDDFPTPTVTVSGIPFSSFKVIVYHSTDTANYRFGYDTIGGVNYCSSNSDKSATGNFPTAKGTSDWGATGTDKSAHDLCEGVNYLVSDVISGTNAVQIIGHRFGSRQARGCIAAIQIVEVIGESSDWPGEWMNQSPSADVKEKFSEWKANYAPTATTFTSAHEKAFLLGVAPAEEEPTLDIDAITVDANGNVVISAEQDLSKANGAVYVIYADTLDALLKPSMDTTHARRVMNAADASFSSEGADQAKFFRLYIGYGAPEDVTIDE